MITTTWFVVVATLAGTRPGPEPAPPPRMVLPVVWEWDAGHPKARAIVTEDGKTLQVLVASGRLILDPRQAAVDLSTMSFRVSEASPILAGAFSVDTQRMYPAAVGKGERVPHSAGRVAYPLVVVATRDGKPNGTPVMFLRGEMMVELFLSARLLTQPELVPLSIEPTGYVRP